MSATSMIPHSQWSSPPKRPPHMKGGRFAALPRGAIRCGGLWADRVVRPNKGLL